MTRKRRDRKTLELALVLCAEWLRDEPELGPLNLTERQIQKMTELKNLCFDALGDPNMNEIKRIKERA